MGAQLLRAAFTFSLCQLKLMLNRANPSPPEGAWQDLPCEYMNSSWVNSASEFMNDLTPTGWNELCNFIVVDLVGQTYICQVKMT